jgi:hypothetical protein
MPVLCFAIEPLRAIAGLETAVLIEASLKELNCKLLNNVARAQETTIVFSKCMLSPFP